MSVTVYGKSPLFRAIVSIYHRRASRQLAPFRTIVIPISPAQALETARNTPASANATANKPRTVVLSNIWLLLENVSLSLLNPHPRDVEQSQHWMCHTKTG
jgi:hypothetical protein